MVFVRRERAGKSLRELRWSMVVYCDKCVIVTMMLNADEVKLRSAGAALSLNSTSHVKRLEIAYRSR